MQNYKKWLSVPLIIFAIAYACTSEHDYTAEEMEIVVEPLTIGGAKDWYQQHFGRAAGLKSSTESDEGNITFTPEWNLAELYADSLWYVVESPLETEEGQRMITMMPDVREFMETAGNKWDAKQVNRLIVLRNKESGETYSFRMTLIPELQYMLEKGGELDKNKYLTHETDFSGMVLYYNIDGTFINSWQYHDGRITGGSKLPEGTKTTKGTIELQIETCTSWKQYVTSVDFTSSVMEFESCEYSYISVDTGSGTGDGITGNGGVDPSGVGNNGNNSSAPDDKKPTPRTDCTDLSYQNAYELEKALSANFNIAKNILTLRNYASSQSVEYGMLINAKDDGSLFGGGIITGDGDGLSMQIVQNTVYTIHTHYNCTTGNKGPSASDVYQTIVGVGKSDWYEGTVIFACDGSEYFIYVEDYGKAEVLYDDRGWLATDSNDKFLNETTRNMYKDMNDNMLNQGYSKEYAHIYSMMALLDFLNSGIKIYIKESSSGQFKEIKVEKAFNTDGSYNYKLSICG